MSSIRQLKSRIRSVKNTKQITRAMEMIAASKMRRAQDATKETSAYAHAANELLTYLAGQNVTDNHPYFNQRQVKNRLLIVIASDKGLLVRIIAIFYADWLRNLKKIKIWVLERRL